MARLPAALHQCQFVSKDLSASAALRASAEADQKRRNILRW